MDKSKKLNKIVFIIGICTLSVLFAFLTSNLIINGRTFVAGNTFDVYFNNIQIDSISSETISEPVIVNKTTLNFSTKLEAPGDLYIFTVDVVNNGTIDAMINSIYKSELGSTYSQILEYYVTYDDDSPILENQILRAGDTKTLKLYTKYKDDANMSLLGFDEEKINMTFELEYIQADESAY